MYSDFHLSPEEARRRRQRIRRGAIILAVLVLLGTAGYFCAHPVAHAIKAWQSRRHAEKAFHLIADQKWEEARKEATAAYQLSATEPEAIRALARFLSRTRQTQAFEFWQELAKYRPLNREDLRDQAAVALVLNDPADAAASVQQLLDKKEGGPQAADWLLAGQLAAQTGAIDQIAGDVAKTLADPKVTDDQRYRASLLQLATSGGNPDAAKIQAEAWTRLTMIARGRSATALEALATLAQRALNTPADVAADPAVMPDSELLQALDTHPLAKLPHKLLADDLRIHADPTQRDRLIDDTIAAAKTADNESLSVLAKWLNGKGEYQRELDTIPLARSLQTRDLFLERLDALGALGRWAEIKELLQSERFSLDSVSEHMYLARCNQQLGESTAATNNWERASEAAVGFPEKLMLLADYAEKNGATDIAASAYDATIQLAPKTRGAWQGRLRLAQSSGQTEKIHAVLAEMLRLWPGDPAIQNDEAYIRLLLLPGGAGSLSFEAVDAAGPLSEIAQTADSLIRREPASLPHRTLLALTRLKQNRASEALELYRDLRIPANALTPSALAVHAAILKANGNTDDATKEAAQIPKSTLLSEESALISGL